MLLFFSVACIRQKCPRCSDCKRALFSDDVIYLQQLQFCDNLGRMRSFGGTFAFPRSVLKIFMLQIYIIGVVFQVDKELQNNFNRNDSKSDTPCVSYHQDVSLSMTWYHISRNNDRKNPIGENDKEKLLEILFQYITLPLGGVIALPMYKSQFSEKSKEIKVIKKILYC